MSLSADAQLRYIVQWFEEWSELQRTDFIPVLADNLANVPYMNGLVDQMSGLDCTTPAKPMTLFQCRIKLFREWYQQWGTDHKDKLIKQITDIDPKFMEKLNNKMQNAHVHTNGIQNGIEFADNEV